MDKLSIPAAIGPRLIKVWHGTSSQPGSQESTDPVWAYWLWFLPQRKVLGSIDQHASCRFKETEACCPPAFRIAPRSQPGIICEHARIHGTAFRVRFGGE